MIKPILSSSDIARILVSICRSAVQEATSMPLHTMSTDTSVSVESLLDNTPVTTAQIEEHITRMFQCTDLANSLPAHESVQFWANAVFKHWKKSAHVITFATSGSTGEITLKKQETALLWQEAQELHRVLLSQRTRIVSAVPAHHVYGFLFTVLLPKVAKIPVTDPIPFPSRSFIDMLEPGDFVVAFPLFWEGILKHERPFTADIHGATSTAPCPPKTMSALLDAGLTRITNIYGSSETGGLAYQHMPEHPLTLFSFWKRITGSANEDLLERVHPSEQPQQPIPMPDNISWISDNTFKVLGRKDKIVQVGGINVSLQKTTECLRSHPDVKNCVVRLMRQDEGNRLKAFVIPNNGVIDPSELRTSLYQWCREQLRPAERPKKISFGTTFPKTAMGKAKDWN